jgi:hypothetical protein
LRGANGGGWKREVEGSRRERNEGVEGGREVMRGDTKIVVQQAEKLALHEIDLGQRKAAGAPRPVTIFRGSVVDIL